MDALEKASDPELKLEKNCDSVRKPRHYSSGNAYVFNNEVANVVVAVFLSYLRLY